MFTKNTLIYSLLGILFLLLNRCKEDEKGIAVPEISSFSFTYDNLENEKPYVLLHIDATMLVDGLIDNVKLEINPIKNTSWTFDSIYIEYSGLSNGIFNELINIPIQEDSSLYKIILTLTDLQGNMTSKEADLPIDIILPMNIHFETVNGLVIDALGNKLLATNNGVVKLNTTTGRYELIEDNADFIPAIDLTLTPFGLSEELWISSNNGAENFNSQTHYTTANSKLLSNKVNQLTIDENKTVYFATDKGISIKSNTDWFENLGLDDLYLDYEITDIASASNGYTYATTNGGGVERFKVDVDGISGATVFDTDWSKLKSNNVLTVFIYDTVQAYGTDAGVAIHKSEYTKWDWITYTMEDGLINDTVLSVVKDDSDNWWFGTVNGLSKFDGFTWTNFTKETHGILNNTLKFLAIDVDGSLWVASDNGLSHLQNDTWINY